jgi:hypothetical protein
LQENKNTMPDADFKSTSGTPLFLLSVLL